MDWQNVIADVQRDITGGSRRICRVLVTAPVFTTQNGVLPVQAMGQLLERTQLLHVRPASVHLGRGCTARQHLMLHLE